MSNLPQKTAKKHVTTALYGVATHYSLLLELPHSLLNANSACLSTALTGGHWLTPQPEGTC